MTYPIKYPKYNLNLSGSKVSFSEPANYCKDFPKPDQNMQPINIYDVDIYDLSNNTLSLHQAYWEYKQGFIIKRRKGLLSITIILVRTYDTKLDLQIPDQFKLAVQRDFENHIYDNEAREKSGISLPENYNDTEINGTQWVYFDYDVNGAPVSTYVTPLSNDHYLMVYFSFMDAVDGQYGSWVSEATATTNLIMSSFHIK